MKDTKHPLPGQDPLQLSRKLSRSMSQSYDADKKDPSRVEVEHIDPDDGVDRHLAVKFPESLAHLTDEQREELHRRATRKLDLLLMPALILLYVFNFIDRQNIATAKLGGMAEEIGLTTQQYNTCVSVLFAGYVAVQVPSNMIASKSGYPGIYICIVCALWGLVSACTGAVHSFGGLAVCRAVLGVCEAAFFPGAIYLVSCFYTKKQMALRSAAFYCGSQIGNACGGLLAIGLLDLDGNHGISGWRWLFIVEGAFTVGGALIFAVYIPNDPKTVRWLTVDERAWLMWRLQEDRGTQDSTDETSNWEAFKLAATDPKTWLMNLCLQAIFISASVTNFFPIVVGGLGFDRTTTLGLSTPPWIVCMFAIIINGWHSDKTLDRFWHVVCPTSITIICNIICIATTKIAPRYLAMCLLPASFYTSSTVILSWISSTMTGPAIKRAIAYAIINSFANTPSIWTSYVYYDNPRYVAAFIMNLAAAVLFVFLVCTTRWYLQRENRKMDRGEDCGINGPSQVQLEANFRYQI